MISTKISLLYSRKKKNGMNMDHTGRDQMMRYFLFSNIIPQKETVNNYTVCVCTLGFFIDVLNFKRDISIF